jgi:hypothetical protein
LLAALYHFQTAHQWTLTVSWLGTYDGGKFLCIFDKYLTMNSLQ